MKVRERSGLKAGPHIAYGNWQHGKQKGKRQQLNDQLHVNLSSFLYLRFSFFAYTSQSSLITCLSFCVLQAAAPQFPFLFMSPLLVHTSIVKRVLANLSSVSSMLSFLFCRSFHSCFCAVLYEVNWTVIAVPRLYVHVMCVRAEYGTFQQMQVYCDDELFVCMSYSLFTLIETSTFSIFLPNQINCVPLSTGAQMFSLCAYLPAFSLYFC